MNIRGNITKYLVKGTGLAALGVVAYDAHTWGKIQSDVYAKSQDAIACNRAFNNTQYLSEPSITTSAIKKEVLNLEMESNARSFVNSGIGYFKGYGSMLVNKVVPLALGAGALFGKNIASKCCAIGLGVYGLFKLPKDILGFGHYNDLNRKF